ncbi:NADH-quinone oxidoreductase subunit C [Lawsonella clevelandensis]|uniref:NADH-quinone oxidoreductase subunit C n=1 Tax=Lawsonella clevelandensis TaxID=1528099 RepID=A0A5E3ZYZ2_9ACTN|nr:NADH-quinone oxidoreductase subunit C [Lawsonella clevelandensis]VHO01545.1 NADH-quinone oxidoreductase subunit C [Lawsonella clevelandensis]
MTDNPQNTEDQTDVAGTPNSAASWTPFAAKQGMWSDGTGDTSGFSRIVRLPDRIVPLSRPFGGELDAIFDRLFELVPEVADSPVTNFTDMPTIYIPREHLLKTMQALRDDAELRYEVCSSVSGVHYPAEQDAELHSVYHLLSMTYNRRLRVEVVCPEFEPHIPSVVTVYPMVNYHERETWDMFGIIFDGHPGLTRILMPDDWQGHPQRKDYQLGGIPVEFHGTEVPPVEQRRSYR